MSAQSIYSPYTYLIGWSHLDIYYYGSRYAEKSKCLYETGCHPDEFWVTYFTSSKRVKETVEQYGAPDIIQIRKVFPNEPDKARQWEEKVLKRMNVVRRNDFLNDFDGKSISKEAAAHGKGGPIYDSSKQSVREAQKKRHKENPMTGSNNPMYGKNHSQEVVDASRERAYRTGFVGNRKGKDPWNKGKKTGPNKALSEARQNTPKKKCECCEMMIAPNIYSRFHGKKCKKQTIIILDKKIKDFE